MDAFGHFPITRSSGDTTAGRRRRGTHDLGRPESRWSARRATNGGLRLVRARAPCRPTPPYLAATASTMLLYEERPPETAAALAATSEPRSLYCRVMVMRWASQRPPGQRIRGASGMAARFCSRAELARPPSVADFRDYSGVPGRPASAVTSRHAPDARMSDHGERPGRSHAVLAVAESPRCRRISTRPRSRHHWLA